MRINVPPFISYLSYFFVLLFISAGSVDAQNLDLTNVYPVDASSPKGFPKGSLVLLADGTEKKIEEIRVGDQIAAYDPVLEDYVVTPVTGIQKYDRQSYFTVMLILEELSASIEVSGGLAGVSLQALGSSEVLTTTGPKKIMQLSDTDLLYCYDEATHRFHRFRVYELSLNQSVAGTVFVLQTEQKNCIINSAVVLSTGGF